MMDCIEAQSVISEALDRLPVDAAVLDAAKSHCRECPQCAQYVRALNAVRRAPLPAPPEDLADRIMTAVRAEAAAAQHSDVLGGEPAAAALLQSTDAASQTPTETEPINLAPDPTPEAASAYETAMAHLDSLGEQQAAQRGRRVSVGGGRMDRRQLIAWGSAAAVLLLVVGISAAFGIMRLMDGTGSLASSSATRTTRTAPAESAMKAVPESVTLDAAAGSAAPQALGEATTAPSTLFVLFNRDIYSALGISPLPKAELANAGQARMTFSADTPPALHPVYTGAEKGAIYIEDAAGELQRFLVVQRAYKGTLYRLRSADISEYGTWPSTPPGIARPVPENNPTGAPTFALDGQDASGTAVYRRVGSDVRSGIAIAPGGSAADATAGNPNWTWWTP